MKSDFTTKKLIDKLSQTHNLTDEEFAQLLRADQALMPSISSVPETPTEDDRLLFAAADKIRQAHYGKSVFIRGLIEFTNYCRNDCYYCGIRCSNRKAERYRLTQEEILSCCREGYPLGFRTFVLQGGEDPFYTDEKLCEIVAAIRSEFPDCAITLSVGEKSRESYQAFYDAGANRFLLRHETADAAHYGKLHPDRMKLETRQQCLYDLKDIGYQIGSGFMVGSPYQTPESLIADLRFLQKLEPDMIGIGPFLTHEDTPFHTFGNGSMLLTLRLISILRLMFPYALIPSTTALGTIHPEGRELGLQAGANVVMPNLSPLSAKERYTLYDNKLNTGAEAAQGLELLKSQVHAAGYEVVTDRGDVRK